MVGRYLVVFALPGEGEVCRLGITATRKIGGAVVRNRARRRVRELADSPRYVIPGHDPLVMRRYPPAKPELEGVVVRLDATPRS